MLHMSMLAEVAFSLPAYMSMLSSGCLSASAAWRRTMAVHVTQEARRSILVDLLTVHALGGKAIVFTQTKREADEVAASLSLVHPCEVGPHMLPIHL